MIGSLEGKLRGGASVRSRSITAYLSEGQIARGLGEIQDQYPLMDLGSYPFHREDRYGTTLVMRGTDVQALDSMLVLVKQLIIGLGGEPVDEQTG